MYTTRFTASAKRDLDKVPPRILAAVIEFAFGDLAREPRRVGKPLRGELAGYHSARRGPYRLLYRIDEAAQTIWVHRCPLSFYLRQVRASDLRCLRSNGDPVAGGLSSDLR